MTACREVAIRILDEVVDVLSLEPDGSSGRAPLTIEEYYEALERIEGVIESDARLFQ